MPFNKETAALHDIQDNIEAIQGFVAGLDLEAFESNRLLFYGVVRAWKSCPRRHVNSRRSSKRNIYR
jgi:hypothetical protein